MIFTGTTSTMNCNGPLFFKLFASLIFKSAFEEYFSLNSIFFSSEKLSPGLIVLTKDKPIVTEITVEKRYNITVLDPIFDNPKISDKSYTFD